LRLGLTAANPVRRTSLLRFALPENGRVRLDVLDVTGRVVRVLADGEYQRGRYSVVWDGRDAQGRVAGNGVYVYRLATEAGTVSRKAVVLR
jgi:flagellar hook assembly protein FlgD